MATADDLVQPFQIESMAAEGRLVRLGRALDSVLRAHDYPAPVAGLLGEAQVLAAVLAGGFNFDGVLTLQVKGTGPVTLLVADVTSDGAMRGYAQYRSEAAAGGLDVRGGGPSGPVPRLLGNGYLAFTIDQGPAAGRSQGVVALEGATLADCAHNYLRRSVQLDAAIKLAVGRCAGAAGEAWRAGGLLVQRTPGRGAAGADADDDEDAWRRAVALMGSTTSDELLDPGLHPHHLLYRLFHEEGVRVFAPSALEMRCRCSRERVIRVLRAFPRGEIESMKVGDEVVVTCEFCNAAYSFDEAMLEALYGD